MTATIETTERGWGALLTVEEARAAAPIPRYRTIALAVTGEEPP